MYVVRLNCKDWINIFITNLGCQLILKAIVDYFGNNGTTQNANWALK